MKPELRIARRAVRQIAAAEAWWRENRPLAPTMFERELAHALSFIEENPTLLAELKASRHHGVRRVLLPRSSYHVYWRVIDDGHAVEILACWHTSRGRLPPLTT